MSALRRSGGFRRLVTCGAAVAVFLGACGGDTGDTGTTDARSSSSGDAGSVTVPDGPPTPTSSFVTVPAPSLADNMLGEPAELDVALWLPASYAASEQRYPVVYFLAGFGESASTAALGTALGSLVEAGQAPEMILVGIDGNNSLGGSFYVDSPVTGNWATAISSDLVRYVDDNYRTIPTAASRGIGGFSMGGFGAFDLAMRHPDVFGSVYALSPGLFAPGGLEQTEMFDGDNVVAEFLALQDTEGIGPQGFAGSEALHFSVAYGAAFAPDPDAAFPHVAYPYTAVGSVRDEEIWSRWEAGYGGVADEVAEFEDNLRSLRGIALDVGTNDQYEWIPEGTAFLADQLTQRSIPVRMTQYDGGHGPVGPRVEAVMFPFFAEVLETEA